MKNRKKKFPKTFVLFIFVIFMGCTLSPPPKNINNMCSVFKQKNGWIENWPAAARKTHRKYGIPIPILMATIHTESGFQSHAQSPKKKFGGLYIFRKRQSSAYGYSQAVDSTWRDYKKKTGNFRAYRTNFEDSIDFIGWYHSRSAKKFNIPYHDAYNLHLAYHVGWGSYKKQKIDHHHHRAARKTAILAHKYKIQMRRCRY